MLEVSPTRSADDFIAGRKVMCGNAFRFDSSLTHGGTWRVRLRRKRASSVWR